jgi:hypothetical protein
MDFLFFQPIGLLSPSLAVGPFLIVVTHTLDFTLEEVHSTCTNLLSREEGTRLRQTTAL